MNIILIPLCSFIHTSAEEKTGVYFIDSILLEEFYIIKKKKQNKVFLDLARKLKSSMVLFFGFKIYIIINDRAPYTFSYQRIGCKLVGDKC